jgi:hypothetical protein
MISSLFIPSSEVREILHHIISLKSVCCGVREVDFGSRSSDIGTPMMFIDGSLLIYIQLEELIVGIAFEVLVSVILHQ